MVPLCKICGLTRLKDALYSARSGADLLGYIFWEPSRRYILPEDAGLIIGETRMMYPAMRHVGVFVDATVGEILRVRDEADFDAVQLHGHESPEACAALTREGVTVIKTISVGPDGPEQDFRDFDVSRFLFDTSDPLKGGTGRRFDLSLLPDGIPLDRLFLSGGLNVENIAEILAAVPALGVDVSSAVEDSPGIKNHRQILEFFTAVKNLKANVQHKEEAAL